jgi:hypothetical protein
MTQEWSPPQSWPQSEQTPYVDWWYKDLQNASDQGRFDAAKLPFAADDTASGLQRETLHVPTALHAGTAQQAGDTSQASQDALLAQFDPKVIGTIPKDTVLIAVIDTGIPLGHRRLRNPDGTTRVLAAWQQSASSAGQPGLPMGRELYAGNLNAQTENPALSINHLLSDHSGGNLAQPLDEDSFNRTAGLTDPAQTAGARDLDHTTSHGAHVLDLVAGVDPNDRANPLLTDSRLLVVNMPPQELFGYGGNFLALYADLALCRIITLAGALWTAQHGSAAGGYPLAINFSFGMQAGPKDGSSPWGQLIQSQLEKRHKNIAPTQLVIPAGNQNLMRCTARKLLGPSGTAHNGLDLDPTLSVPWRVKPGDQTPNFIEIWAKAQPNAKGTSLEAKPEHFELSITPPGLPERKLPTFADTGQVSSFGGFASVYCYAPFGQTRPHFVIALAPTDAPGLDRPLAPAGLWQVKVTYTGKGTQETTLNVQTDLSGVRGVTGGDISYFDDPNYRTHLETGRLRDSFTDYEYTRDCPPDGKGEPWNEQGPVQRKGTHNALAAWENEPETQVVTVVGGYRLSDGMPALYSSTFDGSTYRTNGRATPSALYPSEVAPFHTGVLAAGSKDGSVTTLRGTSMACGLATRDIALQMIRAAKDPDTEPAGNETWVATRAQTPRLIDKRKAGYGMVRAPETGRISRLGETDNLLPDPTAGTN